MRRCLFHNSFIVSFAFPMTPVHTPQSAAESHRLVGPSSLDWLGGRSKTPGMVNKRGDLRYRVVGFRANDTRDVRFENLSLETAEMVKCALIVSRFYSRILIEDQRDDSVISEYLDKRGTKRGK
jgi:hypothetical protein